MPRGAWAIHLDGNGADKNEIFGNVGTNNAALFLDLGGDGPGNDLFTGPNGGIQAPAIATATLPLVTGTSEPLSVIRVFRRAGTHPGTIDGLAGIATADGAGNWSATVSGVSGGDQVLATQTAPSDDTSEHSAPATAVAPLTPGAATPAQSQTADPRCDALRKKLKKAKTKKKKRKLRRKLRRLGC